MRKSFDRLGSLRGILSALPGVGPLPHVLLGIDLRGK
jgi:hypothetical protein